ncbi:hypothetical protein L218DRAFT_64055 [Marasmius fiardii PR-910]|nr:hypothetical protein L218DRAFT_64055 [Marasmius fiardii PR-910]
MPLTATSTYTRKRTCSFSTPSTSAILHTKKKRTGIIPIPKALMGIPSSVNTTGHRGSFKRVEPCRDLPLPLPTEKLHHPNPKPSIPSYNRTLRHYKEQRDLSNRHKQRKLSSNTTETTPADNASPPPSPRPQYASLSQTLPPATIHMPHTPRTSSPLSPASSSYQAPNYKYRRSTKKSQPDLYKQAIFTRMRCTPEGARILHMGPRLALSIMEATRDLERLVGGLGVGLGPSYGVELETSDVVMSDHDPPIPTTAILTQSWLMISGDMQSHSEWEMLTC